MEKALAVANEIIILGKAAGDPVTQMKLQKLMFYAHGWHLVFEDAPLIDQQFEAWKFGPIVPSVYRIFRHHMMAPIEVLGTEVRETYGGRLVETAPPPIPSSSDAAALLRRTWEVFGKYTGGQLTGMTHAEGTPWTITREKSGNRDGAPIPDKLIKHYFDGVRNGKW